MEDIQFGQVRNIFEKSLTPISFNSKCKSLMMLKCLLCTSFAYTVKSISYVVIVTGALKRTPQICTISLQMTELVATALIQVCKSTNKKTKQKFQEKKRCKAIFDSYCQGNHGKRFKRAKIMEKDGERIRAVDVLSDI